MGKQILKENHHNTWVKKIFFRANTFTNMGSMFYEKKYKIAKLSAVTVSKFI